jgi:hypothetical protein
MNTKSKIFLRNQITSCLVIFAEAFYYINEEIFYHNIVIL